MTRELLVQFQVPRRYSRISWERFVRIDGDWIRSKPVFLEGLSDFGLFLPEYLRDRLSLEEWRILIALHLVRLKANSSQGTASRFLGKIALVPRSLFFFVLLYVPALLLGSKSSGSVIIIILPSPIFLISALWLRRSLRRSLKTREFELDKIVADQFGTLQVSNVLEKMALLQRRAMFELRSFLARQAFRSWFVSYWNPSITERVGELTNPPPTRLPNPSIVPRLGLRGRAILVALGIGAFWGSGFVAGILYLQGGSSIVCTDNTCAALVIISVLGFWVAVITGISIAISVVRRFL